MNELATSSIPTQVCFLESRVCQSFTLLSVKLKFHIICVFFCNLIICTSLWNSYLFKFPANCVCFPRIMGNLSISSPLLSVVLSSPHLIVFEVFLYVIQVWELASYLRFNSQCVCWILMKWMLSISLTQLWTSSFPHYNLVTSFFSCVFVYDPKSLWLHTGIFMS